MYFLTKSDIVQINKRTVDEHGGNYMVPYNFLHEENLDYLIEIVQSEMFGESLYPTISEKAALYCYNIIGNHIFTDGNKRTGLGAALIFLNLNNYNLYESVTYDILFEFITKISSGNSSLEECKTWFANSFEKL